MSDYDNVVLFYIMRFIYWKPNGQIEKADLVVFNEKVSSKSGFTRGLFISFSGFSDEALTTFTNGRSG